MRLRGLFFSLMMTLASFSLEAGENPCSEEGESRVKSLMQWDEAMSWVVPFSSRTFSLIVGKRPVIFKEKSSVLDQFVLLHGYFSCHKPLVGIVTEEISDLKPIQDVLNALVKEEDQAWVEFATEELMSKAVAYRNLKKGTKIFLPNVDQQKLSLIEYEVDEVLDLWQGMPAFGLIPSKEEMSPILLFRGTDFSFASKSSWASILSDFDLSGAGLTTFRGSEKKIQTWLEKASFKGKKTKVMGFSLGGILAMYTAIFQPEQTELCIAFNAPGISKAIFSIWESLSSPPSIHLYATQGDLISRFGKIVPFAQEISDKSPMGPIEAHTKIMAQKSPIFLFQIDVEKENKARFRASL